MIIVDIPQGTDEWLKERAGNVSASNFNKIFTPTGSKVTGETRKRYLYQLAAERITGEPEDTFKSDWMQRGIDLEPMAREAFEERTGLFVAQVGLVYLDDRKVVSASPDGLVGGNSGLELKCPKPSTHVEYLDKGKMPSQYIPQVQGCLWVTGRETWHFMSFHPTIDPFVLEVGRDEKYVKLLAEAVEEFNAEVEELVDRILNRELVAA